MLPVLRGNREDEEGRRLNTDVWRSFKILWPVDCSDPAAFVGSEVAVVVILLGSGARLAVEPERGEEAQCFLCVSNSLIKPLPPSGSPPPLRLHPHVIRALSHTGINPAAANPTPH